MATADELLSVPVHTHPVVDSDTYFVIDPGTRQMSNGSLTPNVIMQYDHQSERFTFELPRHVEGHDMMLCNRVKAHYNNIDGETGEEHADVHDLTDLRVNPKNPDTVICSWLITRESTQLAGILSFLIQYQCVVDDVEVYEWHTDIYSDVEIRAGRNNSEKAIIKYSDILEQWRTRLFGVSDSIQADILAASQTEQANIEAKGKQTLDSIPEDYTETHNMADEALRRKADAIIVSETGESIFLDDASDCNLIGLNVYGKTTQDTTTGANLIDPTIVATILNNSGEQRNGLYVLIETPGIYTYYVKGYITAYLGYTDSLDSNSVNFAVAYNGRETTGTIELAAGQYFVIWYAPGVTSIDTSNYFLALGENIPYEQYSNGVASPSPDWPQSLMRIDDPTVTVRGKNLIDYRLAEARKSGQTVEVIQDGLIFSGNYYFKIPVTLAKNTTYVFNYVSEDAGNFAIKYDDGSLLTLDDPGKSFTTDPKKSVEYMYIYKSYPIDTKDNMVFTNIQLELGSEATEYEPYKEIQTDNLSRTLRGIPVSSGGNYTDSNGQQWICDEIDFERGKFIQRIYSRAFDGTEEWGMSNIQPVEGKTRYDLKDKVSPPTIGETSNCICSHFPYNGSNKIGAWVYSDNGSAYLSVRIVWEIETVDALKTLLAEQYAAGTPVTYLYALAAPIETDLTPAEIEAFRALHTNATNTTILNDQNAGMSVKYVADIKRYIYKNVNTYRKFDLVLPEANWVEHDNGMYFTQVLDVEAIPDGKIDLHPTAEQQLSLILSGITMFTSNDDGVVTVYSIGGTPTVDLTIQATEEVVYYV